MTGKIDLEKLRIIYYPDPILRELCQPVEHLDDTILGLVQRMIELMRAQKGIGLAGPQVGVLLRLFVCNPTGEPGDDMVCINPELADLAGAEEREEGCLSLPDVSVPIRRATHARIRACDATGKPYERDGEDLWARVWQHESDHLDGRLIVDYMSEASQIANRRVLKQLQAEFKKSA
jgi:peptide deformylase